MNHAVARCLFVAAFALASAGRAPGAAAPPTPTVDATPFLGDHYPPRRTAFPKGVSGLADVTYRIIPGYRPLTLDLYLPGADGGAKPGGNAGLPLIVYIHGGGWANGHSRQAGAFDDWPQVLASIAARGYAVASLNYRLSGEAPFPAAIQDVKSAIKWLKAQAPQYGIDPHRTVVWGGSAGGQLAALAATTCGVPELEPPAWDPALPGAQDVDSASDCVQGAVTWYGVFDFAAIPGVVAAGTAGTDGAGTAAAPVTRYLACKADGCPPAAIRLASPIQFVNESTPPFLLIHGASDRTVDPGQSRAFHDALRKAGRPVDLLIIPAVDHSFIGGSPEITRGASLEALERTVAFFAAVTRDTAAGSVR